MTDGEDAVAQTRRGRPPGKRGTFTFRVTADLRARLEAEAAAAERPVSEEIEKRLEQSFAGPEAVRLAADAAARAVLSTNFGSREILESAQLYSNIFRSLIDNLRAKAGTDKEWYEVKGATEYLNKELSGRINLLIEAFFCNLAEKELHGSEAYEADALASERRIPREVAVRHLLLRMEKANIQQELLRERNGSAPQNEIDSKK